ncbi:uncharacterized protein LOC110862080 [Folsomia candida]|uniref:uncharacterized protein LOC110862080 n=1 Tax=Folsomia candida TaxID=158441 RepID=UPI0016052C24|nr:uncharacterized protein LOC110862080 [Folsomia candida]
MSSRNGSCPRWTIRTRLKPTNFSGRVVKKKTIVIRRSSVNCSGRSSGGVYTKSAQVVIMVPVLLAILSSLMVRDVYANNRHTEGLNRWSFLGNDDIFSDQLCPNPMIGGNENRIISSSSSSKFNSSSGALILRGDGINPNTPVPNDIWALKTFSPMTFLPCDLRPSAINFPPNSNQHHAGGGGGRTNATSSRVVNKILFMNLSFLPLDFEAANAKICTKFIKLQFDEEEGVELSCDETSVDLDTVANHIYWPRDERRRKKSFSIFRNLERFLKNEEKFRKNFYFQIYFTSESGHSKKCTLQQYELNLSSLGCNSRRPPRIEHVCGEFSCKDLIFPFYGDGKRVKLIWKSGEMREDGKPVLLYPPDYPSTTTNVERNESRSFFYFKGRLDVRFVVFLTILPIVIFGMLVFSLEIIIYITCMRRSSSNESGRDARSQQILQNSLNLWESIPNRPEARTVSFSPVTTNIDPNRAVGSESPLPDPNTTPRRVLKSALKKSTEHLPPPPASFFEMEREYPPTYVEAMKH